MTPDLDNAKLIGTGKWVKDSAYQVYELDGKYYAVIVVGQMNMEFEDWSIVEIGKNEVSNYI